MKPLALFCMLLVCAMATAQSTRERTLLDAGWRFHLGNAADMAKDFGYGGGQTFAKADSGPGPIQIGYNDSAWRQVDLPHDWVVEENFVHDDDGLYVQHGSKPTGRKYPEACIGWYRKTFDIPRTDLGRRLSVEFDAVFRDSMVWLNGHLLGHEQSGYSSFAYDMTDFLNYGGNNVLTVRCDASQYEGWFYEGAGIYRHVWLVKTSPVHIARWGTFVSSDVDADAATATLTIRTMISNDGDDEQSIGLGSTIVAPDGRQVAVIATNGLTVKPRSSQELLQTLKISHPELWSLESPKLYIVKSEVSTGSNPLGSDEVTTTFGVRTIAFDKDNGFFLNGKRVEIKGTCNHQDHAGVGTALPDSLQYYRIAKLKEMGCNAIRTSHNPPTPELLDACDRLGMLVMDENRLLDSSEQGLHDLESLVRRDRNHPSVILWSIGNEEPEQGTEIGARVARTMLDRVHALDPTRPVTYAGNNGTEYEGVNSQVDVRGVNYMALGSTDEYHKAHPDQPMVGSEEASTLSTRGEYVNDPVRGYMSAYDVNKPGWGSLAEEWWTYFSARPYLAGAFVWTGFDYRGEPTPYGWPCISSHFGIMDTCGFPKDNFYYYQAWWTSSPALHLLPHWNWRGKEGKPIDVWCYSNQDEVELLLNGKSLGRKTMPRNGHLSWQVPYEPGVLEARGYVGGALVKTEKVETTGTPVRVVLHEESIPLHPADGVSVVNVSVVDDKGRVVPDSSNDISFSINGGKIMGVGNGDPSSHEHDQFVPSVVTNPLSKWEKTPVTSENDPLALAAHWPKAKPAGVSGDASGLEENSYRAYRCSFDVAKEALGHRLLLSIGQIDDLGWVYINGMKIAETKDWSASYAFDIHHRIHAGTNSIVIIVKNNQGPGGLGGGVSLTHEIPAGGWHRSVFHGLAQIIVKVDDLSKGAALHASSAHLSGAEIAVKAGAK